jgi:hypothetical protein
MSYPITPDPAIHNVPADDVTPLPQPQLIQGIGQQLVEAVCMAILEALGLNPAVSQQAVQTLVNIFNNLFALFGTVGHDLSVVSADIHGIITTFVDDVLGPIGGLLTSGGIFGSSFPKSLPFTFGVSTSGTLGSFVTSDEFQQLLDGLVNNGTIGNKVQDALGAIRKDLAVARSDVSQAILDGTNQTNANTGVAQALANFPNINISSVLGQGSLGADVQALVTQGTTALGGATTTLEGWLGSLQTIPNNNILSQFGLGNLGSDVQAIVDSGVNALTGGSGTGNLPSALGVNLAAISQSHNIIVPPNPGGGTITHDASGNGSNTGSSNALSTTWSHTTASTANLAVVQTATYCADTFSLGGSLNRSVHWGTTLVGGSYVGGTAMSNLGGYYDEDFIYHDVWILWNPPSGAVNVTGTASESGSSIESVAAMAGESDTYISVGGIGSVSVANGANGTNPSITQSSASGDVVVNSFAAYPVSSMGTYSQTSFYTTAALGAPDLGFTAGQAAGASSVTFTDTSPTWGSGGLWTGVSFNLTPILANEIGSGFMSNRTATGTVASTAATAAISSAFYTQTAITSDLTWTASTNTIQVTYAGWYSVGIGILLSGKTGSFGVALFHNGSVAQVGMVSTDISVTGQVQYAEAFVIYLSPNDTIQPAYDSSSASNTMTGEATGSSSYFNVALLNRSVY